MKIFILKTVFYSPACTPKLALLHFWCLHSSNLGHKVLYPSVSCFLSTRSLPHCSSCLWRFQPSGLGSTISAENPGSYKERCISRAQSRLPDVHHYGGVIASGPHHHRSNHVGNCVCIVLHYIPTGLGVTGTVPASIVC